tara:strand:+ start:6613 stop:6867 length:255 start_codon:yes stop_codon:yes gene_type:complete
MSNIPVKLTPHQEKALQQLRLAGGTLDYQPEIYGFAVPGALRSERIQMATAKALVDRELVVASRTKEMRGRQVIDQIQLPSPEA